MHRPSLLIGNTKGTRLGETEAAKGLTAVKNVRLYRNVGKK